MQSRGHSATLWKSGLNDASATMVAEEVLNPVLAFSMCCLLYAVVAEVRTECKDWCMNVSLLWEVSRHPAPREISPLLCAYVKGGVA